jgi:hypothetical protein
MSITSFCMQYYIRKRAYNHICLLTLHAYMRMMILRVTAVRWRGRDEESEREMSNTIQLSGVCQAISCSFYKNSDVIQLLILQQQCKVTIIYSAVAILQLYRI